MLFQFCFEGRTAIFIPADIYMRPNVYNELETEESINEIMALFTKDNVRQTPPNGIFKV